MRIQRLSPQQIKTPSPLYRVFIEDFWIQNAHQDSRLSILPEVIVHQQTKGYRLLFGFGFFEKAGANKIPALIFPQQTATLNWLTELARFVRRHRELYPIEVARLSRLMNYLKIPQVDADNLIHAMTGIKSFSGLVPQLRKLINVVPSIQAFLIAKKSAACPLESGQRAYTGTTRDVYQFRRCFAPFIECFFRVTGKYYGSRPAGGVGLCYDSASDREGIPPDLPRSV